jgi:hypothetical protein
MLKTNDANLRALTSPEVLSSLNSTLASIDKVVPTITEENKELAARIYEGSVRVALALHSTERIIDLIQHYRSKGGHPTTTMWATLGRSFVSDGRPADVFNLATKTGNSQLLLPPVLCAQAITNDVEGIKTSLGKINWRNVKTHGYLTSAIERAAMYCSVDAFRVLIEHGLSRNIRMKSDLIHRKVIIPLLYFGEFDLVTEFLANSDFVDNFLGGETWRQAALLSLLVRQGKLMEAQSYIDSALAAMTMEEQKRSPKKRLTLINTYIRELASVGAVDAAIRMLRLYPDATTLTPIAIFYQLVRQQRYTEAEQFIHINATFFLPQMSMYIEYLYFALCDVGKYNEAKDFVLRMTQQYNVSTLVWAVRASIALREGKFEEFAREIRKYMVNSEYRGRSNDLWVDYLHLTGRFEDLDATAQRQLEDPSKFRSSIFRWMTSYASPNQVISAMNILSMKNQFISSRCLYRILKRFLDGKLYEHALAVVSLLSEDPIRKCLPLHVDALNEIAGVAESLGVVVPTEARQILAEWLPLAPGISMSKPMIAEFDNLVKLVLNALAEKATPTDKQAKQEQEKK